MSDRPGPKAPKADPIQSLTELHQHIRRLCLWAWEVDSLLASDAEPDWEGVQKLFSGYAPLRQGITTHWDALDLFAAPRGDAVEIEEQGYRSWHVAMVEMFVCEGDRATMMLWLGTPDDVKREYLCFPEHVDWRHPELFDREDEHPNLCRSRELIWRRLRTQSRQASTPHVHSEGGIDLMTLFIPECRGWFYTRFVAGWVHIPHLEAEFAASKRALAVVPPTVPAGPVAHVTLNQVAAFVNRSKDTLERRLNDPNSTMPRPDVEGGGGKPHEWRWDRIRPWLIEEFGRPLPEHFPGART